MLIMVNLEAQVSIQSIGRAGMGVVLRSTNTKHETGSNLLPEIQLQCLDLHQWNQKHPNIHRNTDAGIGPRHCVEVDAAAFMLVVPSMRQISDRQTLEDCDRSVYHTVQTVEDHGANDDISDFRDWEDAQVEEQQRQLDERNL